MTGNGRVPFLDLVGPHKELEEELKSVFRDVLGTARFVGGPMVEDFERDFARFCDVRYSVGTGSGTDALRFALIAAGVHPGDIVVTVTNTFIATTEAISQAGAQPDFVDVHESTYNMDPKKLREYLETRCEWDSILGVLVHRKTRRPVTAIVPVHLYGQMADMDLILELAERYKLTVVEDACQAHGAEYFSEKENRWKKAGSMGKAAAFSFYPGKNLGACGEAGAVTTQEKEVARKVRILTNHGQLKKYFHESEGYNGRLDAVQAGILKVKLGHLRAWNEARREKAKIYQRLLASMVDEIVLPIEPPGCRGVYHLFVIRTADREELQMHLAKAGINTGIHYPIPLHLQKAYLNLGYKEGAFPVAERAASQILSLPMFPQLSLEQQERVADRVIEFARTSDQWVQVSDSQVAGAGPV